MRTPGSVASEPARASEVRAAGKVLGDLWPRELVEPEPLAAGAPEGRARAKTSEMSVGEIMRASVVSVDGEAPIGVAADAMVETGLRSIPVVLNRGDRPELVGMVSRGDVIRGFRLAMQDDK